MCGIVGVWRTRGQRLEARDMTRLCREVRARGPDGEGVWVHDRRNLGLGHRRLSILDPSAASAQPMATADARRVLTFNGEIYNYLELREALQRDGWRFRSDGDTEVLLAAITLWGAERALAQAEGMFAFAVWDEESQTMLLARDRFGEKPLYYLLDDRGLVFGSSVEVLAKERAGDLGGLDAAAVRSILETGFIRGGGTAYRHVRKTPPGVLASFRIQGRDLVETRTSYWSAPDRVAAPAESPPLTLEAATDRLEACLQGAVARACRSDVPYGAFLSGGLDSACVAAMMSRVVGTPPRTFTVGFDDALYDESASARATAAALGADHTEVRPSRSELLAGAEALAALCEPMVDPSGLPMLLLAQAARREVKVAITGDGGDELFGGYARYVAHQRLQLIEALGGRAALRLLRAAAGIAAGRPGEMVARSTTGLFGGRVHALGDRLSKLASTTAVADPDAFYRSVLTSPGAARLLHRSMKAESLPWPESSETGSALTRLRLADIQSFLPDAVLQKVDRTTMAVGLEARAPFLSVSVADFALSLPDHLLTSRGRGKILIRRLVRRLLPHEVAGRAKVGFTPPLRAWMSGPLRPFAQDVLAQDAVRRTGLLDLAELAAVRARAEASDPRAVLLLWRAFCLQSWAMRRGLEAS